MPILPVILADTGTCTVKPEFSFEKKKRNSHYELLPYVGLSSILLYV
jgi:hypothetical protein